MVKMVNIIDRMVERAKILGKHQGIKRERQRTIKKMVQKGMNVKEIANILELSSDEIQELIVELI